MQTNVAIRVVAVDGTPPATRNLRPLLRAGGFDLCGHASTATGLRDVVDHTHPDVVVFGTEAPVETVAAARGLAPDAGIVVVWPSGVSTFDADERVEPTRAVADLGTAVRSAHHRNELRAVPSHRDMRERTSPAIVAREPLPTGTVRPVRRPRMRTRPLFGIGAFLFCFFVTLALFPSLRDVPLPVPSGLGLPPLDDRLDGAGLQPIAIAAPTTSRTSTSAPSEDISSPSAPTDDGGRLSGRSATDQSAAAVGAGTGGEGDGGGSARSDRPRTSGDSHGNSGNAPGHSGSSHGNSGNAPGHSGSSHGNSGNAPGHSGSSHGNSGNAPGHSGSSHGNSGNAPGHNSSSSGHHGNGH